MKKQDNIFVPIIIGLSIVIPLAVAALMYLPDFLYVDVGEKLKFLPKAHAVLNGITALLLITGFVLIKNKNSRLHKGSMLTAFILSSIFLISYVISKLANEPVPFGGDGIERYVYFFILISHILLSIPVLPLALFSIYRGMTGEISKHKKIVKWTFPVWLYVAITGVLVYVFMSPYY